MLAASAVALSAYAAHGIGDPLAQSRLHTAALQAFGHGAVLAVLGPASLNLLGRTALYVLLLGVLLVGGFALSLLPPGRFLMPPPQVESMYVPEWRATGSTPPQLHIQ